MSELQLEITDQSYSPESKALPKEESGIDSKVPDKDANPQTARLTPTFITFYPTIF